MIMSKDIVVSELINKSLRSIINLVIMVTIFTVKNQFGDNGKYHLCQ